MMASNSESSQKKMHFCFRVDASSTIGSGHVMRCLTLAGRLAERGHEASFVCRRLGGNLCNLIAAQGFHVFLLGGGGAEFDCGRDATETAAFLAQSRVDWLIVDHYQIDAQWERGQRNHAGRIMVIDDLADRRHDCDLLLDQNLYIDMEQRYARLVPLDCRQLLGPRFALLRKEFTAARCRLKPRSGRIKKILVFFGGGDHGNVTGKALTALRLLDCSGLRIDVVVGSLNPYRYEIEAECSLMKNTHFHCQVNNMADLLSETDLAIGAGGTSTWERCYLGVPCVTVILAENQAKTTAAVAAYGAAWNLGWHTSVEPVHIADAVKFALENPNTVEQIRDKALALMRDTDEGEKMLIAELMR